MKTKDDLTVPCEFDRRVPSRVDGFVFYVRNAGGDEFIHAQSFGRSINKAKLGMRAIQNRQCERARPKFEELALINVTMQANGARWIGEGQPPVSNLFVAAGCEQFA